MNAILSLEGVSRSFGGLMAVGDVGFSVQPGEIFGLIGPNGAGKTTLFNLISGLTPVSAGRISFLGKDILGIAPHKVASMGMARTFQNIRLFSGMSVLDNVRAPMQAFAETGLLSDLLGLPASRAQERRIRDRAMELLGLVGLDSKTHDLASSLPYGERRRLEIARALALRPKLLLLDEPAAGLNLAEKAELSSFIRDLRTRFDLTVLIIEHHVPLVMGLCDRLAVLNFGRLICQGKPDDVRSDQCVIDAYLGDSHAVA
ncbi:amino acid/amide ABC transporter ATP-binding protein 1, HAAT family [Desulfomicrobium apsheronum]|uniref:Amino acid/amide ABC transporter ATP-binding protein 1, HAAT family n=1 Tax=Desulfomicrobium apsheronum TaxID=52560 RepID=A0A1I3WRI1_9BACT|nr:ABC transporter ATP-binding protein [Desulfomicrobium apsheronum]SFK09970.1 amino acid/amide ABC transporter ATP-binding protein 1, HAAT family [Desulfomicrobium apsheronum]